MSWGVDEVEGVLLIGIGVLHLYGMALDGDASFSFEVHVVEDLGLYVASIDGVGVFE